MKIHPARRIRGSIRLPGDKSISHRAALLAAMANGSSLISNFATSKDCASTLACLRELGVSITQEGTDMRIEGVNGLFSAPSVPLDCGNSGSTMRMLAGVLAGQNFRSVLTGDDSLRSRPMGRIIEPLEQMGARVISSESRPPLHIEGCRRLKAIRYEMPVASAQVKTCVLLAGLLASGRTEVVERWSTRDHSERMMQWFDVPLETLTGSNSSPAFYSVVGPVNFEARDVRVPGDFSSAAYFLAAAALLPNSELTIEQLGLNPSRTQFLTTLRSLGAPVSVDKWDDCNEPVGTLLIRGIDNSATRQPSSKTVITGDLTVSLIDELPLLAVVGTQVAGGVLIQNAAELRSKESDRITATVTNLRSMGAEVEEHDDGLQVEGPVKLRGATIDSYGDHRIAMAFTIAALLAQGESTVQGSECVDISFPGFFEFLEALVER